MFTGLLSGVQFMGTWLESSKAQVVRVYDAIKWTFTEREVKTMVILQPNVKAVFMDLHSRADDQEWKTFNEFN